MKKTYERIEEIRDTAEHIHSGDVVWVGDTEGTAADFLSALAARRNELDNVTLLVVAERKPNASLETLRHCGGFRVLSFYSGAIQETYRDGSQRDRYKFLTSPAGKALGLVCRHYNVNTMVLPVSQPDKNGCCSVSKTAALAAEFVSTCPSVTNRIALIDSSMQHSKATLPLASFDTIGLRGDLKTRDIFDNSQEPKTRTEAAA
ncbi:MAG: hypothetical protein ACOX66_01950 [Oscillospiraceae bacterium]|jgi:acyl-CoA hydrolase